MFSEPAKTLKEMVERTGPVTAVASSWIYRRESGMRMSMNSCRPEHLDLCIIVSREVFGRPVRAPDEMD